MVLHATDNEVRAASNVGSVVENIKSTIAVCLLRFGTEVEIFLGEILPRAYCDDDITDKYLIRAIEVNRIMSSADGVHFTGHTNLYSIDSNS